MVTNRLARETSPYLRQHQHNPVDWYPWGAEALQKAKTENKVIFLSVGYATCHWCHVMEHESFEDPETAALMNKHYINIKVDREERPDVDRVYMSYVQATTGRGGWPMSVWLTPDLEPIYGGSYYPKKDMFQGGQLVMPAFPTVLRRVASLWESNREDLQARGQDVMKRLTEALSESAGSGAEGGGNVEADLAEHAVFTCKEQLARRFDARLGGFGGAPKFPRPSEIDALFHTFALWKSRGEENQAQDTLHMALFSLDKMAAGGMFDHVGGGFHRYSVDEYWHVPHFEKMGYDQPPLACAYLAAFQVTGDPSYARTARAVLDYMRRDMTLRPGGPGAPSSSSGASSSLSGGIFSAEDADSMDLTEGAKKEGWFYIWTHAEVTAALGPDLAKVFCTAYNIKPEGNCTLSGMSDPHHEFVGRNVPILLQPLSETAALLGLTEPQLRASLAECHSRLHALRSTRPRPALDNKIVTAWNGMAIGAFALASRVLAAEQPPCAPEFPVDGCSPVVYLEAAISAAKFVREQLFDERSGTLLRSYCDGPSPIPAFADDYAQLVSGLIDLYECGGGVEWLQWAVRLQATMDRLFWDDAAGGYFSTSGDDPSIKIRIKDAYDGAEPTPSSVAACNLLRLAALVPQGVPGPTRNQAEEQAGPGPGAGEGAVGDGDSYFADRAQRTLAAFQGSLFETPLALPKMVCGAHLLLRSPLRQVVVSGPLGAPAGQALLSAAHTSFAPDKAVVVIPLDDGGATAEFFARHNPQALQMAQAHFAAHSGAGPTAFVCQNYTCQAPTADPGVLAGLLKPQAPRKAGLSVDPLFGFGGSKPKA